jgi:methylisocitrate lyase
LAGIILEDQEWPKKCGHFEGKRVIPQAEHTGKIRAAVEARGDSGLVIIARTDARAPLGLEAAIARGKAYIAAGADVLFVEAPQSIEDL